MPAAGVGTMTHRANVSAVPEAGASAGMYAVNDH